MSMCPHILLDIWDFKLFIWFHHLMATIWGKCGRSERFYFLGLTADGDCSHKIKRHLLLRKKAMTNIGSILKSETSLCQQRSIELKLRFFQWSCMYVRIGPQRKLGVEELMLLNCGAREDSWESLDSKEMKPVHPKGNQSWTFIGRTDTEAKAPILWPPNGKFQHIGKDPDAGKDWRQEKRATEDGIDGRHHRLNGHEFDQTLGDSEGPGSLACCSLRCQKEVDLPEQQQSFLLMLIVKSHKNRSKLNPSRTLRGSWAWRPFYISYFL